MPLMSLSTWTVLYTNLVDTNLAEVVENLDKVETWKYSGSQLVKA